MPETTLRTTGIDQLVLYVSDIQRSKKFYLDVLGTSVAHETPRHLDLPPLIGPVAMLVQMALEGRPDPAEALQ